MCAAAVFLFTIGKKEEVRQGGAIMESRPFQIAVCDDDETDREQIERMTQEACLLEQINAKIVCFASAETLLNTCRKSTDFDLLLLDVMMPERDGIALAKLLRENGKENAIVFISGNREKALQGYEVNASRYLAKPLRLEKLQEAVRFCYENRRQRSELLLPAEDGIRTVKPEEIYYIEIVGRRSRIRQEKSVWNAKISMDSLEEALDGCGFVRCHKSYLVNCGYVKSFRSSSMELMDGSVIPVSKYRIREVRKQFFEYYKN